MKIILGAIAASTALTFSAAADDAGQEYWADVGIGSVTHGELIDKGICPSDQEIQEWDMEGWSSFSGPNGVCNQVPTDDGRVVIGACNADECLPD